MCVHSFFHSFYQCVSILSIYPQRPGCPTLLEGGQLPAYEFKRLDRVRIVQMAPGVKGYPDHPGEVVDQWRPRYRTEYDGG